MDGLIDDLVRLTSNRQISEFNDGRATGTVHVLGRYRGADLPVLECYHDAYVRHADKWLFGRRRLIEIAPSVGFDALRAAAQSARS